ncbi:hypothetical protein [Saccharopolyspora sp. SCSIO 74807]|uniref:hypothetical protein n=1 Tax=Saccharopolyspora sp. SCSIO 74807 TaxID=3118084 RepID=UPI0030D14556
MFDLEAPAPGYLDQDRPVRPPRPVWVDLPGLFGAGDVVFGSGWAVGEQVPGELCCWGRASTGAWIALVRYRLARADGSGGGMMLTHWLPSRLVRPRDM